MKAVRDVSIILRFERPASQKSTKSNRNTSCFQRSQQQDKLGRSLVCCDLSKVSQILTGNSSDPKQCINAPGRVNVSKCTPDSPSTLASASLVVSNNWKCLKIKEAKKKLLDELVIFLIFLLQNEWTPLYIAAQNGHTDVVAKLLESGADLGVKDKVLRFFLTKCRNYVFN